MSFKIETDFPVAFESLDHLHPFGTIRDNHSNSIFINNLLFLLNPENSVFSLKKINKKFPFNLLDIGCSGGGFVKEISEKNVNSIGIEGSDISKKMNRAEWKTIPERLFTCDATKPYIIFDNEEKMFFDVVTAWEFFEHIEKDDLTGVMNNINSFTNKGAMLICSVSNFTSPHDGVELHRTRESKEWWVSFFKENGYERDINLEIYFKNEWVRWGTFNFVLVKV
jgi:2-polyprenyl-3-methyl-5-hydroxy-6-metoxy-1,4-benzoquinol methylase